jgi:hypothetical protein
MICFAAIDQHLYYREFVCRICVRKLIKAIRRVGSACLLYESMISYMLRSISAKKLINLWFSFILSLALLFILSLKYNKLNVLCIHLTCIKFDLLLTSNTCQSFVFKYNEHKTNSVINLLSFDLITTV